MIFTQPWFIVILCIVIGVPILVGILNFIRKKRGKADVKRSVHEYLHNTPYQQKKLKKVQNRNAQHVRDVVEKFNKGNEE